MENKGRDSFFKNKPEHITPPSRGDATRRAKGARLKKEV
jgi:hypothetical protein